MVTVGNYTYGEHLKVHILLNHYVVHLKSISCINYTSIKNIIKKDISIALMKVLKPQDQAIHQYSHR